MIIKSLSRKGNRKSTVKQLLSYVFQEHKKSDFIIAHNILSKNIDDYASEFMINEKSRLHIRSNNILVYHEVISMHHLDSERISQKVLKDIAKEFIRLRNPDALYVIVPHYDCQSIHLHIAMSGVEQYTGLSTRISKARFKEIKISLQDKFPELEHSIVAHGTNTKKVISEREFQMKKKKALTEKEQTKELLEILYKQSKSTENFYKRIEDIGLKTYSRNGIVTGIINKRKMRFSTLGFDNNKLNALDIMLELHQLREAINNIEQNIERS